MGELDNEMGSLMAYEGWVGNSKPRAREAWVEQDQMHLFHLSQAEPMGFPFSFWQELTKESDTHTQNQRNLSGTEEGNCDRLKAKSLY